MLNIEINKHIYHMVTRSQRDGSSVGSETFVADEVKNKYTIGNHQYPEDLGSAANEKYGGHRVMFFINVRAGGEIVKKSTKPVVTIPPNDIKRLSGTATKKLAQGIAQVTEVGAYLNGKLDFGAVDKRLLEAISLYIPETMIKSYNVTWGEEDLFNSEAIAQPILAAGVEAGKIIRGEESNFASATGKSVVGVAAAKVLNGIKFAQKALSLTPGNSKAELLFQAVDFNQFTFDYRFAPKSETEAANVLRIIRTFRHHMLPEYFDEAQFLYIYPSEFEIRYYQGADENPHLERHMTAVLKNMTVNYNPNNQFSTFANGMPTHINMTLNFQELAVPTKESSPDDRSGM